MVKTGRWYDSPSLRILVSRENTDQETKFAFIVSKKVSLSSVVRHQIKRKLSSAVEPLKILPGWSVVILAKKHLVELSPDELRRELIGPLVRAKLLE